MKRKDRCPICQGRGWTLCKHRDFKPCECRIKAEKENAERVLLEHNYD